MPELGLAEIGTWSNEMARGHQQQGATWSRPRQLEEEEEAASDEELELAAIQLPDNLTFISTTNQVAGKKNSVSYPPSNR
jgi:hypothetical protein